MATRRTTGSGRTAESPRQPTEKAVPPRRAEPEKLVTPSPSAATSGGASSGSSAGASTHITVSEDARRAMIAQAAYLRAERRGFAPGGELEDWMAAEAEVDALLRAGGGRPQH
jgi:Protein of unknown function (DUF2934)